MPSQTSNQQNQTEYSSHGADDTRGNDIFSAAMKGGSEIWNRLDDKFDVNRTVKKLTAKAQQHPALSIFLAATVIVCSIPIVMFIFFAVITLGLSFMGFIFVEGTLLTLGLCMLSFVLLFVSMFAIGIGAFLAVTYLVGSSAYSIAYNIFNSRSNTTTYSIKSSAPLPNGSLTAHDLQRAD